MLLIIELLAKLFVNILVIYPCLIDLLNENFNHNLIFIEKLCLRIKPVHKWRILFRSLLCYIWSSLSWCFWFWNFSIVRSLCIAQFASFQVSGHLMSMDFVPIITTTKSMPSRDILVHKHGPATGVMPVFIPLMPLWPSIAWVLYHLYVFLLPFIPFLTV